MKFLVLLFASCLLASANAQVRCLNPGSVIIPASPCCEQVAGQGLAGALGGFFDLMDLECKLNIFFDAVITDPEVTEFFNYITGPEFRQIVLAVQDLQEFQDFMKYLCKNLDLDVYLYLNTLGDILGIPRIPHPEGDDCHPDIPFPFARKKAPKQSFKSESIQSANVGGVRGLMDSLAEEMPSDAIYEMWLNKTMNDPYLCPGFLKLSSNDFRAVALEVEYHPEFIRFVQKLEEWGIQMKQFMDDLKDFLWYSEYCDDIEVEIEVDN